MFGFDLSKVLQQCGRTFCTWAGGEQSRKLVPVKVDVGTLELVAERRRKVNPDVDLSEKIPIFKTS